MPPFPAADQAIDHDIDPGDQDGIDRGIDQDGIDQDGIDQEVIDQDIEGADTTVEPRWLDRREMAGWRAFIETNGDLVSALDADLGPTGLDLGDYQVLVYLTETEGQAIRMCDLAGMLQLSPSGLTRRLDGLVRAGWVERRPSDTDRRVMLAALTDAGRAKLVQAAPVHVESVRTRILDHLDDADIAALASIFGKIRAALDA